MAKKGLRLWMVFLDQKPPFIFLHGPLFKKKLPLPWFPLWQNFFFFCEKRITELSQIFGCNFLTYLKCEMGYYWLIGSSGDGSNCYQLLFGCLWLFCGFRRCWSTSKCVSIAVGWLAERILTRPGAGRAKHSCQYWCFRDPLSYTYFWRFCVRDLHVASVDH